MMKKVLLTGGTGFIGVNVADVLLQDGYEVFLYGTSLLPESAQKYLDKIGKYHQIQGNIQDKETLFKAVKENQINYVVHGAAKTPREETEVADMANIMEVNCAGTADLLRISLENNVERFLYLGSVAVYGDACQKYPFIDEESCPCNPVTAYEISKFTCEKLILRFSDLTGLPATILRIADAYGPWERPTGSRKVMSAPCQAMELAVSGENIILPRAGYMGWIYARDVGGCVASILGGMPKHKIYHASSTVCWSIYEFSKYLQTKFPKIEIKLATGEDRATVSFFGNTDNGIFLMDRMARDLGFKPKFDGILAWDEYLAWRIRCL